MNQDVLSELNPWKKKRFRKHDLCLADVANSIDVQTPLVDARPSRASQEQWCVSPSIVCLLHETSNELTLRQLFNKKTNNVAILTYAFVYLWGSPTETGNFVPADETPPDDLPSTRVYELFHLVALPMATHAVFAQSNCSVQLL
jgi:hypothetical protein